MFNYFSIAEASMLDTHTVATQNLSADILVLYKRPIPLVF